MLIPSNFRGTAFSLPRRSGASNCEYLRLQATWWTVPWVNIMILFLAETCWNHFKLTWYWYWQLSNFLMATIGYSNHQPSSNRRAWNISFEWFNLHRCLIKPHQHQQASTVQQGARWSSLHPQRLPWMNQELFNGRIQFWDFWDCGHETRGTCIHDV